MNQHQVWVAEHIRQKIETYISNNFEVRLFVCDFSKSILTQWCNYFQEEPVYSHIQSSNYQKKLIGMQGCW